MKAISQGAYLLSDLPEGLIGGGLLERGDDSQNQVTNTYLVAQIHNFDTVFIPKHTKINMQGCVAK